MTKMPLRCTSWKPVLRNTLRYAAQLRSLSRTRLD
jgi:hypothetical protein